MLRNDRKRFSQSIRLNLKLVGWWPVAVGAAILTVLFLVISRSLGSGNPDQAIYLRRAVETIMPLAFGIQTAFLFGPDNEPALELLLSYPVTLSRLLLDRLLLVAGMHLAVALTATLVFTAVWGAENLALALARWLAAGIALAGVAIFTTQVTRQGVFGTLMVTLLWAASLYGGDAILAARGWGWFWPFHVYLQPEKLGLWIYLLNRLALVGIGLGLFLLAMKFLGDEDRLMGNR